MPRTSDFSAGAAARHRRGGAVDRPLHRRRPLRRPARSRTCWRRRHRRHRPRSLPSLALAGGRSDRARPALRAGRVRRQPADHQFRRRQRLGAAVPFHLGQQPRLHGRLSRPRATTCPASAIAGEGDDMQRDDWYSGQRDPRDLAAPEAIGDYAARRALARLGARKLKTRQVPGDVRGAAGRRPDRQLRPCRQRRLALPQGRPSCSTALGKQIFPEFVHIDERPHLRKGLASSPFDDDGVATRDRDVVTDGVLQGYFLSTYSARKLGMPTTGNAGGSHNLLVAARPRSDFAGLLRQMGTGLAGHRTARPRHQLRHRRLLARRGRLLGGGRRDRLSRA